MSLIDNMRRIMAERGISQSELARRLGIKSQAVNQWFRDGGTAVSGASTNTAMTLMARNAHSEASNAMATQGGTSNHIRRAYQATG